MHNMDEHHKAWEMSHIYKATLDALPVDNLEGAAQQAGLDPQVFQHFYNELMRQQGSLSDMLFVATWIGIWVGMLIKERVRVQ